MYKFEIFRDGTGRYGWRLLTSRGFVLAVGDDRYPTSEAARHAVAGLRNNVSTAAIAVASNAA